jgi:AAA domain/Primase C terminal 1 (PriCT-1)/RepB DNA-primase from phage plasmid
MNETFSTNEQASIAQFPTIRREDAQRFLNVLDDRTARFTFMVFDDNQSRKDKRLANIRHGTLDALYSELVDYSRRGAGVFVTINETNFRGRRKECIVKVRCYFADLDGAPIKNISRLGLWPHMLTQTSPGRFGVFYKMADAPLDEDNFKRTQQALATLFESDPAICNLPRVMRLPGFPHQKEPRNPFVTQIDLGTSQKAIEGKTPIYTEAGFQEALATALAARQPKRNLAAALASGVRKSPPDWTEGYAEGQRNNECARRAGSCFAEGMNEEEALAECLEWNEHNQPPLSEEEVRRTVHSVWKTHTRNHQANVASVLGPPPLALENSQFVFDGEVSVDPPKMLVKRILPATGVAFIGGQSSAGKTFMATALGVSLASGQDFFNNKTRERVGIAYVAAEGQGVFAHRLAAAKISGGINGPIPFAWVGGVPALRTQQGSQAFIAQLRDAHRVMQERFGVRLGAVFIDTVAACIDMEDENSNAEVSGVCSIIRQIGESVGAVMIPIHHYGKDAASGLRGASAWRGAADVVISVTCDIAENGLISNRNLAIAKARDAEQGPIAPFRLDYVKLGIDEDGEEFGTLVVRDDPERGQQNGARRKASKLVPVFDGACKQALGSHSEDVQIGGLNVRAVELKHVKTKFCAAYVTGDDDPKKAKQRSEKAWQRALEKMQSELPDYVTFRGPNEREWLQLKTPNPGHSQSNGTLPRTPDTSGRRTSRTPP